MPSRAYTSFLPVINMINQQLLPCVNALSGLYLISTIWTRIQAIISVYVSMPSRAYTSFLLQYRWEMISVILWIVSMPSRAYTSFLQKKNWIICQLLMSVNALSGLYLISTVIITTNMTQLDRVSMPSRAYTSFLRYPFKNLGFMRFPEPVFAGICQNILTTAVFRAC